MQCIRKRENECFSLSYILYKKGVLEWNNQKHIRAMIMMERL